MWALLKFFVGLATCFFAIFVINPIIPDFLKNNWIFGILFLAVGASIGVILIIFIENIFKKRKAQKKKNTPDKKTGDM